MNACSSSISGSERPNSQTNSAHKIETKSCDQSAPMRTYIQVTKPGNEDDKRPVC